MRKLIVVIRVWLYMRKGERIDAIKLVRSTLIRGNDMREFYLAKDFVEDVELYVWPTHY